MNLTPVSVSAYTILASVEQGLPKNRLSVSADDGFCGWGEYVPRCEGLGGVPG